MNVPTEMYAVVVPELKGPGSVRVERKPVPVPGPGMALIRVKAAGLNYADVMQTRGLYVGGPAAPFVAGLEAAGEVVAVGAGVAAEIGARVLGNGPGAFAEYVAWPAAGLMPLPEAWSFEQGAALFVQWFTAHGCLRTLGHVEPGQWVLVHAAAGGVGTAAVRLAKHFGARVVAVASTKEKVAVATALGADVGVNTAEEDFVAKTLEATGGRGADLVLEMVGGETFERNFLATRPYGKIVVFGAASAKTARIDNVSLIFQPVQVIGYHLRVMAQKRPEWFLAEVEEMQKLIAAGVVNPQTPTAYPLAQAAEALAALEQRKTTGKLVLVP